MSLKNISKISDIVSGSNSFREAAELLQSYLEKMSCKLLFLGGYDLQSEHSCQVILSNFSETLTDLRAKFDDRRGCPLVQLALKNGEPFEALNLYLAEFDEFFSMKYFKELRQLGFDQIGIVPIMTDQQVLVFFVGIDGVKFSGQVQNLFYAAFSQFIAASTTKYSINELPLVAASDTRRSSDNIRMITNRERDCLNWIASGKTSYEISIILNLSEHTINNYINNACKRLNATNRTHAVAITLKSGMIDGNFHSQSQLTEAGPETHRKTLPIQKT